MRRERHVLGWLALALTVAAQSCSCQTAGTPCESAADCSATQVCAEGLCRTACNTRNDCVEEEICLDGACLPNRFGASDAAARDRGGGDVIAGDHFLTDLARADGAAPDAVEDDATAADRTQFDATGLDATGGDAGLDDASQMDASATDGSSPDGTAADVEITDASLSDIQLPDATVVDAPMADASTPDAAATDGPAVDSVQADGAEACGDGVIIPGETCDDGNRNPSDGCSASCQEEAGWDCVGAGPGSCDPICGDTLIRGSETCDDGDQSDTGNGCSANCQRNDDCGDGVTQDLFESCDDGYSDDCGSCNADCSDLGSAWSCGDGDICPEHELCDDGFGVNSDAWDLLRHCNADCNGYAPYCGDGILEQGLEVCDSGLANSDGWAFHPRCNAFCSGPGLYCGDGLVESAQGEDCDDGNAHRHDLCSNCRYNVAVHDTGQGDCFDLNDQTDTCPAAGDSMWGQDAQFGPTALSFTDNDDQTVTDNISGLMWTQQTQGTNNYTQASLACAQLNLLGHGDWRLPEVHELRNVLSYGQRDPALDAPLELDQAEHWTDSPVGAATGDNWTVGVRKGSSSPTSTALPRAYACVRGAPVASSVPQDLGETVAEYDANLMWDKELEPGPMRWDEALDFCAGLDKAGYQDWRLPSIKELGRLFDPGRDDPAIDTALFPTPPGSIFWSSTSDMSREDDGWRIHLGNGSVDRENKDNNCCQARCVRTIDPIRSYYRLPDTGQALCFDDSGAVDCALPTTDADGQDALYGPNGLFYVFHGDGTVTDPVTGLTWHTGNQSNQSHSNASSTCADMSSANYLDWRLPSLDELMSLVDFGQQDPAANEILSISSSLYWTATPAPPLADPPTDFWAIDFHSGIAIPREDNLSARRICLRGPPLEQTIYTDVGFIVDDRVHLLMWEASPDQTPRDWAEALAYCEGLSLAGRGDWRLPNIRELHSLVLPTAEAPAADTSVFFDVQSDLYWSSTSAVADPGAAWAVNFADGSVGPFSKIDNAVYLRCIADL